MPDNIFAYNNLMLAYLTLNQFSEADKMVMKKERLEKIIILAVTF